MVVAIGLLHQVLGLTMGLGWVPGPDGKRVTPLVDLVRDGVIGHAEADPLRAMVMWFLMFGFLLIYVGALLRKTQPSRGAAVGFAALCTLGVIIWPVSGFWLGFIPAVQLWRLAPVAAAR